jgi:N-carbamoylputrescine amidase
MTAFSAEGDLLAKPPNLQHRSLRVALAQLPVGDGNLVENMRLAEAAATEADRYHADFLNLPEAADWGWLYQHARRDALTIPGKYTDFPSELARRYNVWISAGCLEREAAKVYNSAVIINRTGQILLKHRKCETLRSLTERLYDAGNPDEVSIVDTEFGRLGLTICADNFDTSFPRKVAERGAWLLVAPHGFAAEQSKLEENSKEYQSHISNLARKTGLWVVATNAVRGTVQGGEWKGRLHSGCSVVARPDGTLVVVAKFKEPDLAIFDIPIFKA